MKKLLALALVLIISMSIAITAYAAEPAEPDMLPVSEETADLPDENTIATEQDTAPEIGEPEQAAASSLDAVDGSTPAASEAEVQTGAEAADAAGDDAVAQHIPSDAGDTKPVDEGAGETEEAEEPGDGKFRIFGFTISNIITTLLVVGVFITGVVTKKMGKW